MSGNPAGRGRVIRPAFCALAVAVALLVALSLVSSWLAPGPSGQDAAAGQLTGALPGSPAGIARLLHDWTRFGPWDGSSVNANWGTVHRTLSGSPAFVFALVAGLAIALYGAFCRFGPAGSRFDWRVAAAVFLACWIALDVLWQARLLHRLTLTHSTYAGKTYDEKVRASEDGPLVHFAEAVREMVPDQQGRILVGSESDFVGMRAAYYLYPYNVLWQRDGPEIPPREYLRSGDHIALLVPTGVLMNAQASMIAVPGETPVEVDTVLKHPAGYLFRVR